LAGDTLAGRRRWRARWARHGLLARVRGFFLLNGLFLVLATVPQLAAAANRPAGQRLLAAAALILLACWWLRGWRRGRFPLWVEPLEWLVPMLVAAALGSAESAALGVYYGSLSFRPLYGDRRAAVVRALLAVATLVAMPAVIIASGGHSDFGQALAQVPTTLVLSGVTFLLGVTLARQERAVAREQVLTRTGTALTTTTDRQAIYQVAVDTALTLLGEAAGTRTALTLEAGPGQRVVAAAGDRAAEVVGATAPLTALPAELREALERGQPAYGERVATAELAAAVDFTPKAGGVLLLPLRTNSGRLGLLVAGSDRPLPDDVRGSLQTLADQVALGLEAATLTEELTRRAFHDSLTGLANRALLHDRLDRALARTRRHGTRTALLLLDMDGFKLVNDSLGHEAGDDVLVGVARRIRGCVREVDTVGRLGGDEFAIVLEDVGGTATAAAAAERIAAALGPPIEVGGHLVTARVSIGIATTEDGDLDSAALLRNADLAMYHAKQRHAGAWELYQPRMHAAAAERRSLEADLQHALTRGELVVHYQPILALDSRAITGVEALLRWRHPTRGLVPPAEFIPLAEQTGLIGPIGQWVLEQACRQVVAWQAALPAGRRLGLSVNLSPAQLDAPDLVERVAATLRATGLAPRLLVLELTEGIMARGTERTSATLERLKALGLRLAIDDFGTGFSSLGYLERFPIDILKIDRSFVARIGGDAGATPLADAVVRLGHALRLETIAEGIETDQQLAALHALGCQAGQGYLLARPAEPERIRALLDQVPATAA
jgi:diguanylate cyclase (GGDEF)-like protein